MTDTENVINNPFPKIRLDPFNPPDPFFYPIAYVIGPQNG